MCTIVIVVSEKYFVNSQKLKIPESVSGASPRFSFLLSANTPPARRLRSRRRFCCCCCCSVWAVKCCFLPQFMHVPLDGVILSNKGLIAHENNNYFLSTEQRGFDGAKNPIVNM